MKNYLKISLLFLLFLSLPLFGEEQLEVTDMMGRKVILPKEIKTVATIGGIPALNSFIYALGESEKIINGLPPFMQSSLWKYHKIFAPTLKNKPIMQKANLEPELELLLKYKPDVIFIFGFHKASALRLAKSGLGVVVLNWQNIEDLKPLITLVAKIFNKEKEGHEYLNYFKSVEEKAAKIVAKADKHYTLLYTRLENLVQPTSISQWWIETIGAKSVTKALVKHNNYKFSLEQLLAWNPDILMLDTKADLKELLKDPRYVKLKALKNKKYFVVPRGSHGWAHITTEEPLAVLWGLNKLYPKLYSEKELKKDMLDFYKRFYKIALSKAQLEEMLKGL